MRHGNKSTTEYEREFVHLNKYAQEIVSLEEEMCICFEDGLNDEIKMMIGGVKIRKLVVLTDRAQKWKKLIIIRNPSRSFFAPPPNKIGEDDNPVTVSFGFPSRSRSRHLESKFQNRYDDSVASVRNALKLVCEHRGKLHFD